MKNQIEILKQMQEIELASGFLNGDLYNELQDRINSIEIKFDINRKIQNNISSKGLDFCDKSNSVHY